ncbi:MAG: cardiolipin synthase [Bacteroidales bacterium]|nr:cardiolipin synthase [Bacteroidales bacterium]
MLLAELFPYASAVFYAVMVLYALTTIGCIVVVVSENRNPVRSLAWVTVLILLPVVGILIYLFFGRSLKSVIMISRNNRLKLRSETSLDTVDPSLLHLSESSKQIINLVNAIVEPHFLPGNTIDVYTEGAEKFNQLKADLLAAKEYINFQYYIFSADNIGKELADILISKAHEGVKVRVIYDHVGSWSIASAFFKRMRKEGVEAYPFLRVTFPQLANRLNWRNHRKVVIIDGKVGYIGGMNIADRYVTGEKGYHAWRDTHLRIVGNAVKGLQMSFAIDWNFMKRMLLEQPLAEYPHSSATADNAGIQIVSSGPTQPLNAMSMVMLRAISLAKKCIYIQTPYFLPEEGMMSALQAAALSGVDVRIMIPLYPDSKILKYSSLSYVKECLLSGIKVYLYTERMLHAKCVIIDDELVSTGSTNFDFRSFEHNFECNAIVYGKPFCEKMKAIFHADAHSSCTLMTIEQWVKRPLRQRALESMSRLLGPIL